MKEEKTYRVIAVALGGRGGSWSEMLHKNKRVKMVGGVDVNRKVVARHREKYNQKDNFYSDSLPSLAQRVEADLAVIAAPSIYHAELIDQALDAGMHVIVEKPFTVDFAAAQRVTEKAKSLGKQLVVAQNYRYSAGYRALRKAILEERIGAPEFAIVNTLWFTGGHVTGNSYMRRVPHMHAFEMSCHIFDLMRFIFNRNACRVFGKTYDTSWSWYENGGGMAIAMIEFSGGLLVSYNGSFISTGPREDSWRIEGTKGALLANGGQLKFTPSPMIFKEGRLIESEESEQSLPMPPSVNDLQSILDETLAAIEGGKAPQTAADDNLYTLAICDAVARSSDSAEPVTPAIV